MKKYFEYFVPSPWLTPDGHMSHTRDLREHSKGSENWTDIETSTHIKWYKICTLNLATLIACKNLEYICQRTLIALRIFPCNTENVSDTILNYPINKDQKIWSTLKGTGNQPTDAHDDRDAGIFRKRLYYSYC